MPIEKTTVPAYKPMGSAKAAMISSPAAEVAVAMVPAVKGPMRSGTLAPRRRKARIRPPYSRNTPLESSILALDGEDDGDGEADVFEGDGVGTAGSGCRSGELVTSGRASSQPRPSPSADSIPVAVPTATTTEAAATMAPRRAARLRSALRAASALGT